MKTNSLHVHTGIDSFFSPLPPPAKKRSERDLKFEYGERYSEYMTAAVCAMLDYM